MMMKTNSCFRAISLTLLCFKLMACGGGGDQSGDQLLNTAGQLTASEQASRDSAVHALAGEDLLVEVNTAIEVDGSGSYDDLSTDSLSFTWSLVEAPNNATINTELTTEGTLMLSTDMPGTYIVQLTVTDGYNTASDTVTITVVDAAPVAVLPEAFAAQVGSTVSVTGADSYDAVDTLLTFEWSVTNPEGATVTTELNQSTDAISFALDTTGDFTVQLVVTDTDGNASSTAQTTVTATNTPPDANAGADIVTTYNTTIEISAADSSDGEQETLTYSWVMTEKPVGSGAALLGEIDTVTASFFADVPGQYTFQVTVSDGYSSSTDIIIVSAINTLPTVDAGENITIQSGELASLVATATDPETDALTYDWALISQPNGPSVSFNNDSAALEVVLHAGGTYRFEVTVTDDYDAVTDTVDVYVNNSQPVSVITMTNNDKLALRGETVRLSASKSYDPDDGDAIELYEWSILDAPETSVASFSDAEAIVTELTPDVTGEYTLALRTFDGGNYSEYSTVLIQVMESNNAPVARAVYSLEGNTIITLDGSASSDADGHEISYLWSIIAKPDDAPAQIDDRTAAITQLYVQEGGTYAVRLIVSDGRTNSSPYDFSFLIDIPNSQPVANAGSAQSVGIDQSVTLNGGESYDEDGDTITFLWYLDTPEGSTAELSDQTAVTPSFTPDVFGEYTAHLTVADGSLVSEPQTVIITVDNTYAPVADAGRDQNVKTGSRVSLSGANSIDADSTIVSYAWHIFTKPDLSASLLDSTDAVTTSFTPDVDGTYTIALEVSDESLSSALSFVTVVATTGNSAPVANAGADVVVVQGTTTNILLSGGTSTDADGDELSYYWSLIKQPTLSDTELTNRKNEETRLSLDRYGEYLAQLTVFDGTVSSTPDTKLIQYVRSPREVDAGMDQEVYTREIVVLDGRSSGYIAGRDPEDYSYEWEFISTPVGGETDIVEYVPEEDEDPEDTVGLYQFQPPEAGTYVVRLRFRNLITNTVSDVDTVIITAKPYNRLPFANAGEDASTTVGQIFILDGSSSTDEDSDILSYNWSFIDRPINSQATIQNPTSINPFFEVDAYGEYLIQLQVFDGSASSDPDVVIITAIEPTVALDIRTDNGYRSVNLPYSKVETIEVVNPLTDEELIVETFRVSAIEQQITISDVVVYDANGLVSPYMDVAENTVIRSGTNLEIQLITDYPDIGRQANLVFEFTIKETGEKVSASYLLSSK